MIRTRVHNYFAPVNLTVDQAQSLQTRNGFIPFQYYKITDATAANGGSGSVIVQAETNNNFYPNGDWIRPTNLLSFGWIQLTAMVALDTITSINVNGVNQLTAVIAFNTSIENTLDLIVANINANAGRIVNAYRRQQYLVLSYIEPLTASNGYLITTTETGTTTFANTLNLQGGSDPVEYTYEVVYDLTSNQILQVYDPIRDFRLYNRVQSEIYNFRYEDPNYLYERSIIQFLNTTDTFFTALNIGFLIAQGTSKLNLENTAGVAGINSCTLSDSEFFTSGSFFEKFPSVNACLLNRTNVDLRDAYITAAATVNLDRMSTSNCLIDWSGSTLTGVISGQGIVVDGDSNVTSVFSITDSTVSGSISLSNAILQTGSGLRIRNNSNITGQISLSRSTLQSFSIIDFNNQALANNITIANSIISSSAKGLNFSTIASNINWNNVNIDNNKFTLTCKVQNLNGTANNGLSGSPITLFQSLPPNFYPIRRDCRGIGLVGGGASLQVDVPVDGVAVLLPVTALAAVNQINIDGNANLPNLNNSFITTAYRDVTATPTGGNITAGSFEITITGIITDI